MIPYGRQHINQADINAVVDVLHSDFLTQGPAVPAFEAAVADYCGAEYSVAVNSATAALHLACLSLGVGPGDHVWTSPISFVASSNCALYCGASVDFVDIDPKTYTMSVVRLAEKLEQAKLEKKLPKVIIPVHLCGQSCQMEDIHRLSQQYGFRIIEDAAHAIGGRYQQQPIGNCRYSDITVFSFHPVKIITTGEGGMALTNQPKLAEKMMLLRSHGITRDPQLMTHEPDGDWYYQQVDLGFNYRITDLQAALGSSQMTRIDEFVARRRELAALYDERLSSLPLTCPWQNTDSISARHLYVIRLKLQRTARSHRQIFSALRASGIGVNLHYIPIHTQPFYQKLGFKTGDFPESERYYTEAISLPLFATLSEQQLDQVVDAVQEAVTT